MTLLREQVHFHQFALQFFFFKEMSDEGETERTALLRQFLQLLDGYQGVVQSRDPSPHVGLKNKKPKTTVLKS